MKKVYFKPQAKAIAIEISAILAGSGTEQLGFGGSNRVSGPRSAESKGMNDDDWDWDD